MWLNSSTCHPLSHALPFCRFLLLSAHAGCLYRDVKVAQPISTIVYRLIASSSSAFAPATLNAGSPTAEPYIPHAKYDTPIIQTWCVSISSTHESAYEHARTSCKTLKVGYCVTPASLAVSGSFWQSIAAKVASSMKELASSSKSGRSI
jgi:hypothetical protein